MKDPDKVLVQFDRDEIYNWLDKDKSLPSMWMKEFQTIQLSFDKEVDAWIEKGSDLFLKAIDIGDLKRADLLYKKDNVVADAARDSVGRTALHVACMRGQKEIVQWLLDGAKMDLEKPDHLGSRPIHYAVQQ